MNLPNIANAAVALTIYGRVEIRMLDGFVYYDRENYADLTDEDGNPREPLPEEISYFRYGVYAPDTDFDRIVVVAEGEIPPEQIF